MNKSLFFCALLLSSAASAQPSSNASSNGAGAAAADPNAMICRNVRETGSMLNRSRVCKTRAQWEAERRETRQTIDRSQTTRINRGE
jgi:hypothetical protein